MLTFVVVGGGFSGVETVGSLNDFVKGTVKEYYKDIYMTDVKIILVSAQDKILPEVAEELGDYALQKLKDNGVELLSIVKSKEQRRIPPNWITVIVMPKLYCTDLDCWCNS